MLERDFLPVHHCGHLPVFAPPPPVRLSPKSLGHELFSRYLRARHVLLFTFFLNNRSTRCFIRNRGRLLSRDKGTYRFCKDCKGGSNSVVEWLLPKQFVAGSSPVSRSKFKAHTQPGMGFIFLWKIEGYYFSCTQTLDAGPPPERFSSPPPSAPGPPKPPWPLLSPRRLQRA